MTNITRPPAPVKRAGQKMPCGCSHQKPAAGNGRLRRAGRDGPNRFFQPWPVNRNTPQRPFRAVVHLRCTSVFAAGENLGAGGIHCAAVGSFAALRMWRTPCRCFRPAFESPKGEAAHWAAEPKKKDICFQQMSFFLDRTVKIDILSTTGKTAAQRRHPTASPAQRVAVGSEEQGSGRMTSFLP